MQDFVPKRFGDRQNYTNLTLCNSPLKLPRFKAIDLLYKNNFEILLYLEIVNNATVETDLYCSVNDPVFAIHVANPLLPLFTIFLTHAALFCFCVYPYSFLSQLLNFVLLFNNF